MLGVEGGVGSSSYPKRKEEEKKKINKNKIRKITSIPKKVFRKFV